MFDTNNEQFPQGKSGSQCIGPCTAANKVIVHPYTLRYETNDKPFCAINPNTVEDPITKKEVTTYIDECYVPMNKVYDQDYSLNLLLPNVEFNCNQFLKLFYKIDSFDMGLEWITTSNAGIFTKLRVVNCCLKIYKNEIYIVDNRLIHFYMEVIAKIWIHELYLIFNAYIIVEGDQIYLSNIKNEPVPLYFRFMQELYDRDTIINQKKDAHKEQKYNFLIKKFGNRNLVFEFLNKYIFDKITTIDHLSNQVIKDYYVKYLLNKLRMTI